jgi:hypothetical protein
VEAAISDLMNDHVATIDAFGKVAAARYAPADLAKDTASIGSH